MRLRATRWLMAPLVLTALWPATSSAQQTPAGVVTTVKGDATVVRPATPQPLALKLKDAVFARDRIETRQDAIVRVLLGGKAVVTVRELSIFTITETPGRATIELASGRAALGVAKSQLQPGESVEIRTPNAVAAVRGSLLIAEVIQTPGAPPQSGFTALEATLPITVAPLSDPTRGVALRVNEAVNVLGLGTATSLGPVRIITPAQALVARQTAQAPKPAEQTDRPPSRLARQVSGDKTREAAELGEALARGEGGVFGSSPFSAAIQDEISGTEQTFRTTQEVFNSTSLHIDEVADATSGNIQRGAAAEPLFNPDPSRSMSGSTATLGPTDTLATFSGNSTTTFAPVSSIFQSDVTQTGGGGALFVVEPNATVTLPGRLVSSIASSLTTDGAFLTLGDRATLTSGIGLLPLLQFVGSDVTSGGELVRMGADSHMTLVRSLLIASFTDFNTATGPGAPPFISVGRGATLELQDVALSLVQLRASGLTTGGSLLALGEDSRLTTNGLVSIFGLLDFGVDLDTGLGTAVVTHGDLVTLGPRARIDLNQDLLAASGSAFTVGGNVISLGTDSQITTSGLSLVFFTNSDLTATGSFLALGSGARVESQGTSALALMSFVGGHIQVGGDLVSMAGGSRLTMDRPLLVAQGPEIRAGGSLLAMDAGAVLESGGPSGLALMLVFDNATVATQRDVVQLRSGAVLTVRRPLLHFSGTTVTSAGGLLGLGLGATLSSPDTSTVGLLLAFDSDVRTIGDLVNLGGNAQINMVRPLLGGRNTAFNVGGSVLSLGAGATLTSTGAADSFISLAPGSPTNHSSVTAGRGLAELATGSSLSIARPLLFSTNTNLTLPTGLLSVAAGGRLTNSSTDPLVTLALGTHSLASASGAAMFSLTGSVTGLDVESGLTLGTSRPVQHGGSLLSTLAATVTGQTAARFDTALFEASAPLLSLRTATNFTTSRDAVDLSLRAKVTSLGPAVRLDASTMTIQSGSLFNVGGGSFFRVTGDLVELANGSTLSLLNGPVLSANAGSLVNVSGSFIAFTGTGNNRVNITNNLCPCTLVSGVPVALRDGALATNVVIGPNAIKNPSLGTVSLGNPNTAAIVLSGPTSRVSIAAP